MSRLIVPFALVGAGTIAWVALWGDVSWANVLVGAVLSVATLVGQKRNRSTALRVEPVAFGRLLLAVLVDLGRSTVSVAKEVITPTDYTEEAVIGIPLDPSAMSHALLLTAAITLTPGTAVIEVDQRHSTLYLHVLHAGDREEITAHVHQLADLAVAAFPTDSPAMEATS